MFTPPYSAFPRTHYVPCQCHGLLFFFFITLSAHWKLWVWGIHWAEATLMGHIPEEHRLFLLQELSVAWLIFITPTSLLYLAILFLPIFSNINQSTPLLCSCLWYQEKENQTNQPYIYLCVVFPLYFNNFLSVLFIVLHICLWYFA